MVNSFLRSLASGLFPENCILCELPIFREVPICRECVGELQPNRSCCLRCAAPLPETTANCPQRICGACQASPPPFDRVVAPWLYCPLLAQLIRRWKFHGERRLTPLLASLWLQEQRDQLQVDALVPVPLHWRRLWQRGFNQSELFCRCLQEISQPINCARLACTAARRTRATSAQSGIGGTGRKANLAGAFTVKGRYDNLRLAIVDDVFTTGATATELAGNLRAAGATSIEVWCLARTPGPNR